MKFVKRIAWCTTCGLSFALGTLEESGALPVCSHCHTTMCEKQLEAEHLQPMQNEHIEVEPATSGLDNGNQHVMAQASGVARTVVPPPRVQVVMPLDDHYVAAAHIQQPWITSGACRRTVAPQFIRTIASQPEEEA